MLMMICFVLICFAVAKKDIERKNNVCLSNELVSVTSSKKSLFEIELKVKQLVANLRKLNETKVRMVGVDEDVMGVV